MIGMMMPSQPEPKYFEIEANYLRDIVKTLDKINADDNSIVCIVQSEMPGGKATRWFFHARSIDPETWSNRSRTDNPELFEKESGPIDDIIHKIENGEEP